MKTINLLFKLLICLLIISCNNNDDENQSEEATIIATWTGVSSSINNQDLGVPSNNIVKFTSNNRTEFVYEDFGNNGEDIIETGSWVLNDSILTITWDESDNGQETYVLTILELSENSMTWETLITGEGTLRETFEK